jgi:hypothetical protein
MYNLCLGLISYGENNYILQLHFLIVYAPRWSETERNRNKQYTLSRLPDYPPPYVPDSIQAEHPLCIIEAPHTVHIIKSTQDVGFLPDHHPGP